MKISIIMPVYNAAAVVGKALASIEAQTFTDFELICVDDSSTDGSGDKLREYAQGAKFPVKVLAHEVNQGAAAARNTAIDVAEGEYLAFIDADDSMAPETLEISVAAAEDGADIVGWDWYLSMSRDERYMRQADYSTPLEALKNIMSGVMRWNLWMFLSRRSLWDDNGIRFIPGMDMGEDMMAMNKLFCCAGKVAQVHKALYHYNAVSTSSISRQFSESNRAQVSANVSEVERYVSASRYADELAGYVDFLKLKIKLPMLVSGSRKDYLIWRGWYAETNGRVMKNKAQPLRTRLLQLAARLRLWPLVWGYYVLVEKVIYGLIYR